MVTLTTRARELLTERPTEQGMAWVIQISWVRGDVEKVVDRNGEVSWKRDPPRGWRADLFGDTLESLASQTQLERHAPLVFVQPWLLSDPPFPGGEIDIEAGGLIFRPNAA